MKVHYQNLGVDQYATITEIKAAYRKRAMVFHPDHGGSAEHFRWLTQSYNWLLKNHKPIPKPREVDYSKNYKVYRVLKYNPTNRYTIYIDHHPGFIEMHKIAYPITIFLTFDQLISEVRLHFSVGVPLPLTFAPTNVKPRMIFDIICGEEPKEGIWNRFKHTLGL